MSDLNIKLESLVQSLRQAGNVAVAFSGGVDSTFLLKVAQMALADGVLAITARSSLFPERETNDAIGFAANNAIRHLIYDADEFAIDGFATNPINRCYLCKKNLFTQFKTIAAEHGITCLVEGSNVDDNSDFRPGMIAIEELQVLSPLREAGFSKAEIRQLSHKMSLPTSAKPALACLASRFPYGENLTREKLKAIETAEQILFAIGFKQARVRHHGSVARIEVTPADMQRLMSDDMRELIYTGIKKAGFVYVAVDIQGYRTGSMNETIGK